MSLELQAPLERRWIEAHIPHRGAMCLFDAVLDWNSQHVLCRTNSHRRVDNPLRSAGRLGIACGVEYGAQAAAIHGALRSSGPTPAAGMLVSIRGLQFGALRLDEADEELLCAASLALCDAATAIYDVELRCAGRQLLAGRITVVFDAARMVPP